MAEEFHESLPIFNTWTSLRSNDLFSCSSAVNAGENAGSFSYFPATTEIFELTNETNSFVNSPQFSSLDLFPSSIDWSQTFLESFDLGNFHGSMAGDRVKTEESEEQIVFSGELPDSRGDTDRGFVLSEDRSLPESAMDESYVLSPLDFPSNGPLVWNRADRSESFFVNVNNSTGKSNTTGSRDLMLPTTKKLRIESSSSLPTFKVRKEKLGDRITALQQLVSPFGKTDTASVLHEAIDYINFLHDQVSGLSSAAARNGRQWQNQQNVLGRWKEEEVAGRGLRNRGLCLVPISRTAEVAGEEIPPVEFWAELWRKL